MRRHHPRGVDQRAGDALLHLGQRFVADAGDDVAGEHQLRLARRDARGVQLVGRRRDANVRDDGTVLLREAGHVEHAAALALEVRGHSQQRADGHDPGAADAGDQYAVGLGQRVGDRIGERRKLARTGPGRLLQPAALDGDEAGTEALEA